MPKDPLFIDVSARFDGSPSSAWGPLATWLADRLCILEYFAQTPRTFALASAVAKLQIEVYAWHRADALGRPRAPRLPVALVLCNGHPRDALSELHYDDLAPWCITFRGYGPAEIRLVDLSRVPDEDGLRALRLLRAGVEPTEAEIETLLADPRLVNSDCDQLTEAIVNEERTTDPEWDKTKPFTSYFRKRQREMEARCEALAEECDRVASERDRVVSERDRVVSERDRVVSERDRAASERDRAASERDRAEALQCAIVRGLLQGRGIVVAQGEVEAILTGLDTEGAAEFVRRVTAGEPLDDYLP